MWLLAEYQPTALFSLRSAEATSSGGKTLLIPTPFAIRMALLDAAIRTQGLAAGKELFPIIRDVRIAVQPPSRILVIKTFIQILRLKEFKDRASEKDTAFAQAKAERKWPYQNTIAYREYVQWAGDIVFAFSGDQVERLSPLLWQINYLGKRGGFLQLMKPPYYTTEYPDEFTLLSEGIGETFPLGVLQLVDDWSKEMTFEQADVYDSTSMSGGRVFHEVILPYRPARSSRSFSLYERL